MMVTLHRSVQLAAVVSQQYLRELPAAVGFLGDEHAPVLGEGEQGL
jgi:hypothetical protein